MAVFGWPDLGKLNRVTEKQRGAAASGKNARGLRPQWAPGASRPGTGVRAKSMQKSPCPGTGLQGPKPRRLNVLRPLLPRTDEAIQERAARAREWGC